MEGYVVYMHTTPSNKKYIGITMQEPNKRWASGFGYIESSYFYNAIKKYGWENIEHRILIHGLTKEQAINWEKKLIKYHKSNNRKYGYNLTKGGECTQFNYSTRLKMSKTHGKFGEENPFYGKRHTEETKQKIREKLQKPDSYKPKIKKPKLSQAKTGEGNSMYGKLGKDNFKSIDIYCVELKKIFHGIHEAERQLNVPASKICAVCKGRRMSTHGLHFKYLYDIIEK